ncbi:MAG: GIY-YIG nuclease family protein [Gammaproteobacteria bacterium]
MPATVDPDVPQVLPSGSGTYFLWLRLGKPVDFRCGALGEVALAEGWAGYAGSAFGPGGLASRLRRHLGTPGRFHWHIDYLRRETPVAEFWFSNDRRRREHLWARVATELQGASIPARGFGSSDCRCEGHLVHLPSAPRLTLFIRHLVCHAPNHSAVMRRVVG